MSQQLQLNDLLALIKQNPQLGDLLTNHYLKQQPMMLAAGDGATFRSKRGFVESNLNKDGSYGEQPGMMTAPAPSAIDTGGLAAPPKKGEVQKKATAASKIKTDDTNRFLEEQRQFQEAQKRLPAGF